MYPYVCTLGVQKGCSFAGGAKYQYSHWTVLWTFWIYMLYTVYTYILYYAMLCYTILYYTILFYTILYIHKCIYIIMKKIDTLVSYDIWLVSSRSGSESEKKFGQSGVRLATRQDVELGATHVSWTTRRSPWLGLVQANMGRSICASR